MSKKLQVLYEEYKKSQGYSDGGKVDSDDQSPAEHLQENLDTEFKLPSRSPHELSRDERNALIRKQNSSNAVGGTSPLDQHIYNSGDKGYAKGGKVEHNKKNLEELKKAFAKFINEEGSENYSSGGKVKGYADGTEEPVQSEEDPMESDDSDVEQLDSTINPNMVQERSEEGLKLPSDIALPKEEEAANKVADEKIAEDQALDERSPASEDKDSKDESDDKSDDSSKDDEDSDKEASDEKPDESAYSRLLASMNPNKLGAADTLAKAQAQRQNMIANNKDLQLGNLIGAGIASRGGARVAPLQQSFFDSMDKGSDLPVKNYEEQIQNQQFDANSPMSATVREYLSSKGFKVPEGSSAADLFKIAPFLQKDAALDTAIKKVIMQQSGANQRAGAKIQSTEGIQQRKDALYGQRTQAMKESKDQSLSDKQGKDIDNDFGKLEKRLTAETGSSRSAFGKSANVIRSAEAAQALIDQVPGGNLDNRQIKELARSIDSMLSNGAATMTGSQGLIPSTYSGDAAKIEEYLMNQPKGAGQQAFVQRLNDTLKREKAIAQKQINATQNKILSGYSQLKKKAPERYGDMMKAYGVEPMVQDQGKQSASINAPPVDADLSKMSPDELKSYISTHGGK